MTNEDRKFSGNCPDGCPPADADPADGSFYRLCQSDPPEQSDYATYDELGLRPHDDQCLRCGLSVFSTARGAVSLYRYMERRHKGATTLGRFIARLELTPDDGKVKQTNRPPHHTWWMFEDTVRPATYRETVKELGNAQTN